MEKEKEYEEVSNGHFEFARKKLFGNE